MNYKSVFMQNPRALLLSFYSSFMRLELYAHIKFAPFHPHIDKASKLYNIVLLCYTSDYYSLA